VTVSPAIDGKLSVDAQPVWFRWTTLSPAAFPRELESTKSNGTAITVPNIKRATTRKTDLKRRDV
jgi:hypothetical protein